MLLVEPAPPLSGPLAAYRIALGDLARWLDAHDEQADLFSEQTIVAYLADYRRRAGPAPATYYRRFVPICGPCSATPTSAAMSCMLRRRRSPRRRA